MAVAAFRKIWDYLVGESEEDEDVDIENREAVDSPYDYNDEEEEEESNAKPFSVFRSKNNSRTVASQSQAIKMKIMKPTNYDDDDVIIGELKAKNGIVMNLEYVNKDIARRVMDTVSGAVTALDGTMEKVSNAIFVVAPYNYDIINEPISKEKSERSAAPWAK